VESRTLGVNFGKDFDNKVAEENETLFKRVKVVNLKE